MGKIKNIIRRIWSFYVLLKNKLTRFDYKNVPIIIVNFNQLFYLRQMVDFLLKRGLRRIIIIDNCSTYPPLLTYYSEMKDRLTIHKLKNNEGHKVFWEKKRLFYKYAKGYYVLTDPDILLNANMPQNFLAIFKKLLDENKHINKVGTALRIDDIPDSYPRKQEAIEWEKKLNWAIEIDKDIYEAPIDTTFALYRPGYITGSFFSGIRIAGDFTARHGGWYVDENNMTEEQLYYSKTATSIYTWKVKKDE